MSDAYTFVKRRQVGNASAKLVLYAIAEYANENGISQPSSARLREDTELSARTISTSLDLLEERQVIRRERSTTEKGKRAADRIILIGYRDWLRRLRANPASSEQETAPFGEPQTSHMQVSHMREDHMQPVHMQNLHVEHRPQDVVVSEEKSEENTSANSAHAIRQLENNFLTEELGELFVEGAVVRRRSKAQKAELDRITDELWYTWPPVARKRHTRDAVRVAIEAELRRCKGSVRGSDLVAAGKRHVAERMQSGAGFVKGLVPFVGKQLYQNWMEDDAPYAPPVDEAERRRRIANFEHDGFWDSKWGPKPSAQAHAA